MSNKTFDKNTLIGFLLIGAIFVFFSYFNNPEETTEDTTAQEEVVTEEVQEETQDFQEDYLENESPADTSMPDSLKPEVTGLAAAQRGQGRVITLENELMEIGISTRGGQVVRARLKEFSTYDSLPLYLIRDNSSFNIKLSDGESFNSADLVFNVLEEKSDALLLELNAGEGRTLRYEYKIESDNYLLDWDITSEGMERALGSSPRLIWEMEALRTEKNKERENNLTRLKYRYSNEDDVDDLSASGDDEEDVADLHWIAYRQQFFSSILLNREGGFDQANVVSKTFPENNPDYTKYFGSRVSLGDEDEIDANLGLYFGPNKYDVLESYDEDFEELVPLGWGILGWINRGVVINIFNWLENYGLNYGIIILILAVIIKLVLFPLTYTSYRSMAKMRVLKPEIDEINDKYKDKDPMKKQQAVMDLYSKAGVSPLGGCIPVLFQMPILLALFHFLPASIELRHEPFLWASDLSTYDSIAKLPFTIPFYGDHVSLFTLLMTITTLMYTYMNQQMSGTGNQQMPQLKYIMYLMPIMFLGVLNSYPAALSYYYFVANIITFSQQFAIRAFIDDDKIHAKIQEKKKKPGKQNRFMRRMQEMQEEQNRQARRSKK